MFLTGNKKSTHLFYISCPFFIRTFMLHLLFNIIVRLFWKKYYLFSQQVIFYICTKNKLYIRKWAILYYGFLNSFFPKEEKTIYKKQKQIMTKFKSRCFSQVHYIYDSRLRTFFFYMNIYSYRPYAIPKYFKDYFISFLTFF